MVVAQNTIPLLRLIMNWIETMSTIYNVIFTASHSTNLLPHDNNAVVSASARHTSKQIDSKLDVHHRNNYNRTNHRLQHSPQIVVGDDVDFSQTGNDPYWNNGSRGLSGSTATLVGSNVNTVSRVASQSGSLSAGTSLEDPNAYNSIDSRRYTERRKKTVRFDGQESNDWTRWDSERQNSQDSTTRDSGIDTSSTFTSSEDSNRGEGLKVVQIHQISSLYSSVFSFCFKFFFHFIVLICVSFTFSKYFEKRFILLFIE